MKRKPQENISYEYGFENHKQNAHKLNPETYIKELYSMTKWNLSQKCKFSLASENQSM